MNETKLNHNKKGAYTMKLVFDNGKGFMVTSEQAFIRASATVIGTGIVFGIFDEGNREVMSKAIAEFLAEFRKNPTSLDITSYSYIEARALSNLSSEGVDYPNKDILEMFRVILAYYMHRIDKED